MVFNQSLRQSHRFGCVFMPQSHGGRVRPPWNPRKAGELSPPAAAYWRHIFDSIAGRKGGEGLQEAQGLARDGTRWPSGARPTQPLAGGQVVRDSSRSMAGESQRRRDAKTQRNAENVILHWNSLRLCVSAALRFPFAGVDALSVRAQSSEKGAYQQYS